MAISQFLDLIIYTARVDSSVFDELLFWVPNRGRHLMHLVDLIFSSQDTIGFLKEAITYFCIVKRCCRGGNIAMATMPSRMVPLKVVALFRLLSVASSRVCYSDRLKLVLRIQKAFRL